MNGINTSYIQGYANSITGIINDIIVPVLIAIAFLVFLIGVYKYFIKGADDPKAQETGRTFVLYGVIGFVVLFSVWGIVQILMGTLSLGGYSVPKFPTIGGSGTPSENTQSSSWPGGNVTTPGGGITPGGGTDTATVDAATQQCIQGGGPPDVCRCAAAGRSWNLEAGMCSVAE